LGQVVLNLLLNAAQAIPEGDPTRHQISIRVDTTSVGMAILEVQDTGCGIPAENLPRIFDPFFTTKPIGKGTGLGLAVCRGLVAGLGGSIAVDSNVDLGTTFRVELPLAEEDGKAAARRMAAPSVPQRRGHVLIIDDDRQTAAALGRLLSRRHD